MSFKAMWLRQCISFALYTDREKDVMYTCDNDVYRGLPLEITAHSVVDNGVYRGLPLGITAHPVVDNDVYRGFPLGITAHSVVDNDVDDCTKGTECR